jgi:hypothetical protein
MSNNNSRYDINKFFNYDSNTIEKYYYPYQEQARNNLYKINLSDKSVIFEINQNHLHLKLQKELFKVRQLNNKRYEKIVTNTIGRLYESENFEYFHTSGIRGKIFWKII